MQAKPDPAQSSMPLVPPIPSFRPYPYKSRFRSFRLYKRGLYKRGENSRCRLLTVIDSFSKGSRDGNSGRDLSLIHI